MAKVGRKVEGLANGIYSFVEYSVQKTPKKQLRIVVQKNPKGTWYIYKVTPSHVESVGWSMTKENAIRKATEYIRKEIK
jgi:hypothetical protein